MKLRINFLKIKKYYFNIFLNKKIFLKTISKNIQLHNLKH